MTRPQQPTVGRIVHYVSRGSADGAFPSMCRAAIVTEVLSTAFVSSERPEDQWALDASLAVLNPTGMFFDQRVPYHDHGGGQLRGGTWHWPERA